MKYLEAKKLIEEKVPLNELGEREDIDNYLDLTEICNGCIDGAFGLLFNDGSTGLCGGRFHPGGSCDYSEWTESEILEHIDEIKARDGEI